MELRVLRYFLAVAKEGSISKAAESLYITQPTLSRQLMELEEEFGKKLFIRDTRKLALTDEGILLRKRAEEILDLAEKTQTEIMASDKILNGDIYIGSGETEEIRVVIKLAKKLQKKYPRIKYHIFSGNAEDVTEKLDKGLLDFGIVIGNINLNKYNFIRLKTKDIWGILMKKDNPLSSKDKITIDELYTVPILCSKQALKNEIKKWAGDKFEKLNITGTYNLIFNASLMAEENMGCVLSLDKLIKTDKYSSLCFRPLEPKLESEWYFVWKKSQIFSKAAEKFLEELEMYFNENSFRI